MKLYTALKGIQGIFAVFFFLVLLWLSGDGAVSPLGCRLTILSGFVMTFVFLGLDLVSWRRLIKKEARLTLLIQTDLLTRLPNSCALHQELAQLSETVLDDDISCAVISFDNIHRLNRTYGHQAGDMVFGELGDILAVSASDLGFIGRKSGRTFLALFEGNAREKAALFQKRLNRGLEIHNATTGLLPITCTIRLTHNDELHYVSIYDLVKLRPDSCGAHSHAPA